MNISISSELEKIIADKVSSGSYNSANEVVREALMLLHDRDEFRQKNILSLNNEIQLAINQINEGLFIPGEIAYRDLIEKCDHDINDAQ